MKRYLKTAIFLIGLLAAHLSYATDAEAEKLSGTIESVLDVIYGEGSRDQSIQEKQVKVRALLESSYDLDIMIRRAIGRNWQRMNAEEQTRVLELVKQITVKSYVRGMEGKQRPEVKLGKLVAISDKRMEVDSTIRLDGNTYYVLYRLGRMPSGWQIYDIVAENISVVSNYRQQIDDHFRRKDTTSLIERLEELLNKDEIDETIQI